MHDNVQTRIIACLKEIFQDQPDIHENTRLEEIGLDSMNYIRLIVGLEDEFEIEINDEDIHMENFASPLHIHTMVTNYI
ncbi:acyl carrier protein [Cohnella soli]|uniref:Acyl carrier protein n=1 Tax=Cohnella soli TaxID=425005 RepID=A0ABW0I3C0_9BACL